MNINEGDGKVGSEGKKRMTDGKKRGMKECQKERKRNDIFEKRRAGVRGSWG